MTSFLFDCVIKVSIVLFAGLVAVRLLRRHSAAVRHSVLSAALLCAALVPAFNLALPPLNVSILRLPTPEIPAPVPPDPLVDIELPGDGGASVAHGPVMAGLAAAPVAPPTVKLVGPTEISTFRQVAPSIWLTGALFGFAMIAAGIARLAWIGARSERMAAHDWLRHAESIARDYKLRRPLRVLRSRSRSLMATWGFFKPDVLVPEDSVAWSSERIEIVLSHEFAHVRRGDWVIQMLAAMMRAVYWFNPLAWLVCRRLETECEQACDDAVLGRGVTGPQYATHLLELAKTFRQKDGDWMPALSMARRSTLERRFQALLTPGLNRSRGTYASAVMTFAAFLAIGLPVAALRATTAPPAAIGSAAAVQAVTAPSANGTTPTNLPGAMVAMPGPQNPQQQGTPAAIEGVVVGAENRAPLRGARLELRNPTAQLLAPAAHSTKTDAAGRFVFEGVAPGDYRLIVVTDTGGYVATEYGQASPNSRGSLISLRAGQRLKDLQIAMTPAGSITGRVIDRDGEPVGRAEVQALQAAYKNGRKVLRIAQSIQTNDLGEYRLYWLSPGPYYVTAKPESPDRPGAALYVALPGIGGTFEKASDPTVVVRGLDNGEAVEDVYAPVYYPGVLDARSARAIDVPAGQTVSGTNINVSVGRLRGHHVRGTIVDTDGKPAANVRITITLRAPLPSPSVPNGATDSNGHFDISGVPQGQYFLFASINLPGGTLARPNRSDAFLPIEIGSADIDDLRVVATPSFTINARIRIEGHPAIDPDLARLAINYSRDPNVLGMAPLVITFPQVGTPTEGTSTFYVAPGQYRFIVAGLAPNMYVKSIRLGSADLLADPVTILSQPDSPLEAVIGVDSGAIDGRVLNSNKDAATNVQVVLVPDAPRRGRADLYRVMNADASGKFQFQGLEPGGYKLFSWEDVESGQWHDADFIQTQEGRGRPMRVESGSHGTAEITVIPRN